MLKFSAYVDPASLIIFRFSIWECTDSETILKKVNYFTVVLVNSDIETICSGSIFSGNAAQAECIALYGLCRADCIKKV
mgnify:CR=1 FL=1